MVKDSGKEREKSHKLTVAIVIEKN